MGMNFHGSYIIVSKKASCRIEFLLFFKRGVNYIRQSYIEINRHIMKKLTNEEIQWIVEHCDEKLEEYYSRKGFK